MNTSRRRFIGQIAFAGTVLAAGKLRLPAATAEDNDYPLPYPSADISDFSRRLRPVGRILETEGYYVWCNSPIRDADGSGRVHVYYSRWPAKHGMGGWINRCEIAHATAASPEGPYEFGSVIAAPRAGHFDATTCHNPSVHYFDGKYYLYYMGTSDGRLASKRIGCAVAKNPAGPWTRCDEPLLQPGPDGAWDDLCNTNPAVIKHPARNEYWLYYKALKRDEYFAPAPKGSRIRGNRRYGLAIAQNPGGPFIKYDGNPVLDFAPLGDNKQLEDAFVWTEDKKINLICRDMGFYDHFAGLLLESKDGLRFDRPRIAYGGASVYKLNEPPAPRHLGRYGRFERPQLLMRNGKPEYLFTTAQGGKHMTASGFVFKIE